MALIPLILKFYEAMEDVCSVSYQETNKTLFRRASWVITSVSGINEQLLVCCEELKKGVITEPISGDIWKVQSQHRHPMNSDLKKSLLELGDTALSSIDADLYFQNPKIQYFKDLVSVIEDGIAQMNRLLDEAQEMISNLNPAAYGNYYHRKKSELDENSVRASYQQWKLEEGPITLEKLKVKQIETLANAIKTGIMKHDTKPVHKENLSVNMDLFIQNLPEDYEFPEPFVKCCAKLRRYVSWNDDILQIHYNDYGRYICRCMYKFTLEQLAAIYELDTMLSLIHQDMVKLRPELAKHLVNETIQKEEKNYFAIVKNLSEKLMKDWFWDFRTDKKYSRSWIENFLNALMESEWGDAIFKEWRRESSRLKLVCKIIGSLIDANVLDVSYNAVAPMLNQGELPSDTLANYIGLGKKQDYFTWICEYVRG